MEITAYIKNTGERVQWDDCVPLPQDMTLRAPGAYSRWDEQAGDFVFDREKWLDALVRPERDARLEAADRRVRRRDYQLRAGLEPVESDEAVARVLAYMQELRDIPATAQPDSFEWPSIP